MKRWLFVFVVPVLGAAFFAVLIQVFTLPAVTRSPPLRWQGHLVAHRCGAAFGPFIGAVAGEEARQATRNLAETEGIFGGYSSGANLAAALQLLNGKYKGKSVCITLNDSGLKYLSTDLWQ